MIYLPIAEMPVNVLLVLLVSGAVGFVSGLVGVGGGFIMTPASDFPWRPGARRGCDRRKPDRGDIILRHHDADAPQERRLAHGAGCSQSAASPAVRCGVWLFERCCVLGQLDLIISVLYLFLLSSASAF